MIAFLVLHWRLVAMGLLALAAAVQTYRLQALSIEHERLEKKHSVFVTTVEGVGRAAKAEADAKDAHNQTVKEELGREIERERQARTAERAARADRFGALYARYLELRDDPGSTGGHPVPEAGGGAGAAVRASPACLDAERLAAGLRRDLEALHGEIESLLGRGQDALDDRRHWGQWARSTGACPPPPK